MYEGKRLVSTVRGSDYAHAGEEEAIDFCLSPYSKNRNRLILDVDCGQGGTAHFTQRQGWGQVTGCDIEASSIHYATEHYPDIKFITAKEEGYLKAINRYIQIYNAIENGIRGGCVFYGKFIKI